MLPHSTHIGFYNQYKIVIKKAGFVFRFLQISLFLPSESICPNSPFYTLEIDKFPMNLYLIGILALQDCETLLSTQDVKGGDCACVMFPDLPPPPGLKWFNKNSLLTCININY